MPRTVLVPADSLVLQEEGSRTVHRYSTGATLVEVAPTWSDNGLVPGPPATGLQLIDVPESVVSDARAGLQAPGVGGDEPTGEDEREVSAYVEFVAPPDPVWLQALLGLGITVLAYHPENSYLCLGTVAALKRAQAEILTTEGLPAIGGVTELTRALKPGLVVVGEAGSTVVILLVGNADERSRVVEQLESVEGVELLDGGASEPLDAHRFRVRARVQAEALDHLLTLPRVLAVEPYGEPVPEDEAAGLILAGLHDATDRPSGSYRRWLQDYAVDGSGVAIGVVDGGVDLTHPAFRSTSRDLSGGQRDWHATMVAGHALGGYLDELDASGFAYGLGTAPGATLLSQDKLRTASELARETVREAGPAQPIQNNSWGKQASDPMDYGSDEALYDALVRRADSERPGPSPLTICFSSGNNGPRGLTRPKAAKNVIVTGNSENYRPTVGGVDSDNIAEVYSGSHGSSYGNCGDGRIRPHVVAPGEWTSSANFDCRQGEDEYVSPRITWGGGSSGASPKTAGACALIAQWWRHHHDGGRPSPAMLRALVVNGAEPISTGGAVPNNRQGWGRLNVGNVLDATVARVLVDESILLASVGETRQWRIVVDDPTRPLKVTLAWTDPPGGIGSGGSRSASVVVNRLALRVEAQGETFRGMHDRFRGGWSASDRGLVADQPGLLPEGSDNLQNVFLPADGVGGAVVVSVSALSITTDCLTGGFAVPQQDFALVISNGRADPTVPATVAVAVDGQAGGPAPVGGTGHWSPEPGNDDGAFLDQNATVVGPDRTGLVEPPESPTGTGAGQTPWWADAETDPGPPDPGAPSGAGLTPEVSEAAGTTGPCLIRAVGHDARLPETRPGTAAAIAPGLSEAIAALRAAAGPTTGSGGPPSSVLVVGAGTRTTLTDLAGLRALVTAAPLFLVSSDVDVLAFLAQRIGPRAGLRFRLAPEPGQLAELVADTVAEAGGLQRVAVVASDDAGEGAGAGRTFSLDVVSADRTLVVHVRLADGLLPLELVLLRPGGEQHRWRPESPPQKAGENPAFRVDDGWVEIRVVDAGRLPGSWTLRVAGHGAVVRAWSAGGQPITVRQAAVPAEAESADEEQCLLQVTAGPGSTLRQISVPVAGPSADAPRAERPRDVVVRARRGRLDHLGGPVPEDDRTGVSVGELGHVVTCPPGPAASVLDLALRVAGTDAGGAGFARVVHTQLVRTRPMSTWLADPSTASRLDLRHGHLRCGTGANGVAATVEVANGSSTRSISLGAPSMADLFARPDLPGLEGRWVVVGVQHDQASWLFVPCLADVDGPRVVAQAGLSAHVPSAGARPRTRSDVPLRQP